MAAAAGGKKGKKKWAKSKQREKANMEVLFAKATYEKMMKEAPKVSARTPPARPRTRLLPAPARRHGRATPRRAAPSHGLRRAAPAPTQTPAATTATARPRRKAARRRTRTVVAAALAGHAARAACRCLRALAPVPNPNYRPRPRG